MGLSRVLGLCAAFLFASPVSAAVTIDLGPSDYKNFGSGGAHTGAGICSSFGQTVRMPPLSTNLSVTRNAVVPYASAAARMRPFTAVHPASVAASAAITGLFLAMEWYFDEEIGEWSVREVENIRPVEGSGWQGYDVGFDGEVCFPRNMPTPMAACEAMTACYPAGTSVNSLTRVSDTRFDCRIKIVGGNSNYGITITAPGGIQCPSGSIYNGEVGACQQDVSVPVTQGEYSRLAGELPNLPANEVAEATGDAQRRYGMAPGYHDTQMSGPSSVTGPETTTTTTDPVTGDTIVTNTQTTTNITYGDTTITTTNTTVTNTYENGNHTSTETTTETPGELPVTDSGGSPPVGEWPGFCDWASIVCDWIGWTQEEPDAEPDLPQVIDDDFYEEKTIQFGSKSCPPDYEINIPFINSVVAVPMQPLCDFAGIIYYMVMAAVYIIAAYITIGVARNG